MRNHKFGDANCDIFNSLRLRYGLPENRNSGEVEGYDIQTTSGALFLHILPSDIVESGHEKIMPAVYLTRFGIY